MTGATAISRRAQTTAGATRVLLVDDHRMFAELLAIRLGEFDDIEVVGRSATAAEAVDAAAHLTADVVVLDYRLPDADGIELAAMLTAAQPECRLVMLTGYQDPHVLRDAVAADCVGFVTKDRDIDQLVGALRAAARGEAILSPDDLRLVSAGGPSTGPLTEREVEITGLLATGASTRAIAQRLFISVNTVRNHVQRVLQKLGAHSRLEAVATARRLGVIEDAEP